MFKNIFKNTSWLFLAEAINKGVFFLITIIIARNFGSELFGQFNYAISFVIIFSVIADFGINNLLIREIARDKGRAPLLIGNSFIIKIFLSFLTLGLILISTIFINKPVEINILVYILAFYVIFNSYNTFSKSIYRAFEKMKFETFLKGTESIILLVYILLISIYIKDLKILTLGFALASVITFIISIGWVKKFFTKFHFKFDKKIILFLLKESWPFALAGIFVTLYFNIDTVMVSWIRGDIETGWYSASYNFIFAANLIPSLMSASFYPLLARSYKNSLIIDKVKKYLYSLVGTGVALTLMLVLFSRFFIDIVYGSGYSNSVYSLKILSFVLPFSFVCNFIGVFLASINKQKIGTYVTGLVVILNVFLNYFFILKYGQVGAAAASLISFIVMFVILMPIYIYYSREVKTKLTQTNQND